VEAINQGLIAGKPYRSIAKQHGASAPAVYRHAQDHLPIALIKAKEAHAVTHGDDLLAQLRGLQAEALGILAKAERSGDLRSALGAIREARSTVELLARLTGQFVERREISGQVDHVHSLASWTVEELEALVEARDRLMAGGYRPELQPGVVVEGN
jgi:ethanolamine utilization microcompartment shell protein EutS